MPYSVALDLPAWEVRLWARKLSREPFPLERIEWMLAQLTDLLYQLAPGKGKKKTALADWMLFAKAWDHRFKTGDKSKDAELEALKAAFGGNKVVVSDRKTSK